MKYRKIGAVGMWLACGLVIWFVSPHIFWAPWAFALLMGGAGCMTIMSITNHIRRSIIIGIVLAGYIVLRIAELNSAVNIGLLVGLVVVEEVYFWE